TVQSVHRAYSGGLFSRPEPGLRRHPLLHPTLQGDVVKPVSDHTLVHRDQLRRSQSPYKLALLGILLMRLPVHTQNFTVSGPVCIFWWVKCGITNHRVRGHRLRAGFCRVRSSAFRRGFSPQPTGPVGAFGSAKATRTSSPGSMPSASAAPGDTATVRPVLSWGP